MGYSIDKTSTLNLRLLLYRLLFYNLYKIDLGSDFKKLWVACNSNFELSDSHQFILKVYKTIPINPKLIIDYEKSIYKYRLYLKGDELSYNYWEEFLYQVLSEQYVLIQ